MATGIQVGLQIPPGTELGKVGNSGTSDGARGTDLNCHLHFEVWLKPDAYLGKKLTPERARGRYAKLFGME